MEKQDHYAILGIPYNADTAAIRRAYRQTVKQIHPDVSANKAEANEAFLRVKEAYNVLSNPQRRTTYDLTIANRRARARTGHQTAGSPPGAGDWTQQAQILTVPELLQRAMREMATGRNRYASRDLADVLAREPENPDAMFLMGRLYRSEGRNEEWIRVLQEGMVKSPGNSALRLALNDALKVRSESPFVRETPEMRVEHRRRAIMATGLMGGALTFLWGATHGGPPIAVLDFAVHAPAPLVLGGMVSAAFAGWTMASTGYIARFDDELFYPDTRGRSLKRKTSRNDAPLGLAVPVMALIHYFLAVTVIVLLMITRGTFSRSLVIVSAVALGIALAMGMARGMAFGAIMWWCPGWLLFAEFCGWYIGEFFRT